ncbi:MAG: hypothetical protein GTN74_01990 [Proteobacteria bacterium]|nr:hypothetical protein [Pseudomonadota bacterium]NIS67896.1 hypothetical protein [Pseudomonadota bacterium]
MNEGRKSPAIRYLKYGILIVIALAVGLFFLFQYGLREKPDIEGIEREAVKRIEELREESEEPIDVEQADRFVSAQTALSKKDQQIVTTTPKALLEDESLEAESEIKVLVEEEKTVITTLRELLKDPTIGPHTPIRISPENGKVEETTPQQLLSDQSITHDTPIKIVQKHERVITTTVAELQKSLPSPETPVKIVVERPAVTLTLGQILPVEGGLERDTFYIHSVTKEDVQGIWGIIQHGLIDQFLRGIPVGGEDVGKQRLLTLEIPEDADELRGDGYSSYLGKVLAQKTREAYVYNYAKGHMGRNPDYISPGQELVISRFSEKELVDIYRHFHENP